MLPVMRERQTVFLCMGSACHQLGGYRLLPVLEKLIEKHGVKDRVEVNGAFCLETCQQGRSMKFADRVFTGLDEPTLEALFIREILPHLNAP
jgi:NADH:ubiquinone oxidoreductase subunit E